MKKSTQESDEQIKLLKYKIKVSDIHLYLCGFVIINCKQDLILRICSVASYNPSVYEIDINQEIKKLETLIYKYKFDEGSCADVMKKFYIKIHELSNKVVDAIDKNMTETIKELLSEAINIEGNKVKIDCVVEPIKYNIIEKSTESEIPENVVNKFECGKFFIKMKPVIDNKKGVSIDTIKPQKNILCELVDEREIVQNIISMLFTRGQKYFYTNIVKIVEKNKKYYELTCAITPVIFTKIVVSKGQKVVVKKL